MKSFARTIFIGEKLPYRNFGYSGRFYGFGSYYYMPYVAPENTVQVPVEHLQIPPGELAAKRGTLVEATDRYVGKVEEFVINSKNGHITHLVMREGHLWGKKDVIIPLSTIRETGEYMVLPRLDRDQVESLPTFPVHRRWA